MYKSILSVFVAVIFLLSGCTGKTLPAVQPSEPVTLRVAVGNALPPDYDFSTDPLVLWLQERTGCRLEFCQLPRNPDMCVIDARPVWQQVEADLYLNFSYDDDVLNRYGSQGALLDLQAFYNDKTLSAPFWSALEENFSPEDQALILSTLTQPDTGAIYTVPGMYAPSSQSMDYQLWINTQWLSQTGMEMPQTVPELVAVLERFQQQHPGCVPLAGGSPDCPAPGSDVVSWLINQFVYFDDKQPCLGEKANPSPTIITPEFRQALTLVHNLAQAGYLMTHCRTEELEAMITGRDSQALCGMFAMDRASMTDPDAPILEQYAPLPPLQGQYCVSNPPTYLSDAFISADTPYPREAFAVMMALFTPEGTQQMVSSRDAAFSLQCCGIFPGKHHPAADAALALYQPSPREGYEKKPRYDTYALPYILNQWIHDTVSGKADPADDSCWRDYLVSIEPA